MAKNKIYITTPLYYVNAKPHIGHAYTNVLADTFTRYWRFLGKEVFFLTGTDEHGTKIEKIAREKNMDPRAYVDSMVPLFKSLWQLLGIQSDYFIRTTDDQHKQSVQAILKKLEQSGDIYKASYHGWYCTPCESFWTDLQLVDEKCPDCKREVQRLSEENYFFKLSKYQTWLVDYIKTHEDFIRPEMRRNEILGFLKEPLEDLCITRPRARLEWGIDYPNSKDHVVYVWFDALVNYISAAGYGVHEAQFETLWPANLHLVGKDILRQHTVYWPIMLRSLNLPMPKTVLAHGWWMMSGAKVSKSRGNAVEPELLVAKYGVDTLRYYLMREVTLGQDGTFTEDLLRERYTTDLANDLGNVWFRFASMVDKYFQGILPEANGVEEDPLFLEAVRSFEKIEQAMSAFDPREALGIIFAVITKANQFVEENKPWTLAKDPAKKDALARVLVVLGETIAHEALLLSAFLPDTSSQILARLKMPKAAYWIAENFSKRVIASGCQVEKGAALFPKLEEESSEKSV